MTVLIIACPCALHPGHTNESHGRHWQRRRHRSIRSGEALQTARAIQIVVLDKTGTITKGKPELTDVVLSDQSIVKEDELLKLASSVEKVSEHPLAQAIVEGRGHGHWNWLM